MPKARGKSGSYTPAVPKPLDEFDYDVLGLLPDEGARKGRYMPDAKNVVQIKRELDPMLGSEFISSRLKVLRDRELIVSVRGVGGKGTLFYQRTEAGKKTLSERPI